MTSEKLSQTIANLVTEDFRLAEVFRNHKIDFCCGGGLTLEEACRKKGVSQEKILEEMMDIGQYAAPAEGQYANWAPDFLADYILNVHHDFVKRKNPEILQYAKKVARVHGDWRPEMVEVAEIFEELANELEGHMRKEEMVLFPWVKQLAAMTPEQRKEMSGRQIEQPIRVMMMEHETAGDLMEQINRLTNGFTPPEGACNTFRVLLQNLEAYEKDLHKHVHLENNILFPKAMQLTN